MSEQEKFIPEESDSAETEQGNYETVFDSGYVPVDWGGAGQEAKVLVEKTPEGKFRVLTGIKDDAKFRAEMGHPPLNSQEAATFGWFAEAPVTKDFKTEEEALTFAEKMATEMNRWLDDDYEYQ